MDALLSFPWKTYKWKIDYWFNLFKFPRKTSVMTKAYETETAHYISLYSGRLEILITLIHKRKYKKTGHNTERSPFSKQQLRNFSFFQ